MAYRRSITTRAKLFAQHRLSPTFAYVSHDSNNTDDGRTNAHSFAKDLQVPNFLQGHSFNSLAGFGALIRSGTRSQLVFPAGGGAFMSRHMSTTVGESAADKIEYMTDAAEVLADKTMEAVASTVPAVSEVAVAAADSYFPVACLQYVIDYVHHITGFNWWASIIVTTLLIRTITVPLMIGQLKSTSKLTLMRPRLEAIKQEVQDRGMSPPAVAEGQERMQKLFKEYGVSPWTPLKGIIIQGPIFISFFLAIQNMVEKVPSFKEGGVYWFTDLTTPDSLYIFPVLTALTFFITVECNMQLGMEGNPAAKTMKNISRVFAVLTVPLTASFPKAIFCYWMTANVFSLFYGLVIKKPNVKKFFGVPEIPVEPPTTTSQPSLSFFGAIKKYAAAQQQHAASSPTEAPKPAVPRIPPSSVLSQRIKSLEKQVKGRKKGKKR
ncbi:hypothetical protein RJ640_019044 [Escallonia rubra]|uniref:Membrane insertase YidC/Oxa/ALB C-terminal domain-containing protein n=1 Tax=Escallonia rubra TaxID=112253 RepID=A0AA88QPC1_9ASTE|nr:hypothetical protein RJ640_019044 [Escallonia rubra]